MSNRQDDALPALPTPWDYCYVWNSPFGLHRSFSASHYNGQPCDDQVLLFTADQMRAYTQSAIASVQARRLDAAEALLFETLQAGVYGVRSTLAARIQSFLGE